MRSSYAMKVSIVIPNYNGREFLETNLPSIISAQYNPKNKIFEIVIVDDRSTDESVSYLNNKYKNIIRLIKHTKNRGFSATVNTGVRSTTGDFICLLNTDVLPSTNFLELVLDSFRDEKVFAVSLHEKNYGPARGYFEDGFIQISSKKESKEIENSFYVSGGSGVFRKSIWQELGGLDEKLLSPFYWEDIDICFRAAKRGYLNLWNPFGRVVHNNESTISKLSKKYIERVRERNQLLMLWKNLHSKAMFEKHLNGLFKRILKNPRYLRIILMSLFKLGLVIKARRKEIKECIVSDEAVFQKYQ